MERVGHENLFDTSRFTILQLFIQTLYTKQQLSIIAGSQYILTKETFVPHKFKIDAFVTEALRKEADSQKILLL